MADMKVEVHGLRELASAFRQIDKGLGKEFQKQFKELASVIAGRVRGKMPSISGKAQSSITPRARQSGASIAFGGSKAPYEPWLDFGGSVGRGGRIKRPFIKEGRYLYPTIRESRSDIQDATDDALKTVIRNAGFEQRN